MGEGSKPSLDSQTSPALQHLRKAVVCEGITVNAVESGRQGPMCREHLVCPQHRPRTLETTVPICLPRSEADPPRPPNLAVMTAVATNPSQQCKGLEEGDREQDRMVCSQDRSLRGGQSHKSGGSSSRRGQR